MNINTLPHESCALGGNGDFSIFYMLSALKTSQQWALFEVQNSRLSEGLMEPWGKIQ